MQCKSDPSRDRRKEEWEHEIVHIAHLSLRHVFRVEVWSKHLCCNLLNSIFSGLANQSDGSEALDCARLPFVWIGKCIFAKRNHERNRIDWCDGLEEDHYTSYLRLARSTFDISCQSKYSNLRHWVSSLTEVKRFLSTLRISCNSFWTSSSISTTPVGSSTSSGSFIWYRRRAC
jgi:hypothetical protein